MFYANCHLMCPLILENAKAVQKQLPEAERERLGVAMITLDPARDTPQAMAGVAERHRTPEAWRPPGSRPGRRARPGQRARRATASATTAASTTPACWSCWMPKDGRWRARTTGAAPDPAFLQQVRDALATR